MSADRARILAIALIGGVSIWLSADPAEAICGRKSCVVGSTPTYGGGGGGGGGYDPFAGMGGMVNMMFGVIGAIEQIEAQQQQMAAQQLYDRGNVLAAPGNQDYVAAIAAYQQALRLRPGDPNIRAALQRAEQALDDLRRREAARQAAERAALQQRIAGIIGGLSSGFDGASPGAGASAPSSLSGVDFAPAGTSFFGTGGGAGGASPSVAAKAEPRAQPKSGTPAYGAANPPPQQSQGLDFAGTKDPLFEKGHQGSSAPVIGDSVARAKPSTPPPASLPEKLDFSTSTTPAQPTQVASVQPDPIVYRPDYVPWAIRTFIQPAEQAASNPGKPPAPAPAKPIPKDFLPPEMAPKQPMAVDADLDLRERRAREIANLAFERMGTAEYDSAVRFLEVALEEAPGDTRIQRALTEVKDIRAKVAPDLDYRAKIERERAQMPWATDKASPMEFFVSRAGAAKGYEALHLGDYGTATEFFSHAALTDPNVRDFHIRIQQARIGQILAGKQ